VRNVPAGTLSERRDLLRACRPRIDVLAVLAEILLATGSKNLSGADGRCELEQTPAITAETARRLARDASVVGFVETRIASRSMSVANPGRSRPRLVGHC
jgi:hypothetical protein